MDAKATGKMISTKRKEKGLTQLQLAEILNVSNRTVSKWENGDGFPDITLLPEISKELDITIDELLTGVKPEPVIIENNQNLKKKVLNDFKICYTASFCLAVTSAILGGITEIYSAWAFSSTLFYTHWEIMFAAASLFFSIASAMLFTIGILRLRLAYSESEIFAKLRKSTIALSSLLTVFPFTFIARIINCSPLSDFLLIIMPIIFLLIVIIFFKVTKKIERICNEKDKDKKDS